MAQQQRPEQHQQGQNRSDGQNPPAAANKAAQKPQSDTGAEVATRARTVAEWGNLPDYLGAIKQRGGVPEVSEKYRKLYDAYLRNQAKKPGTPPPGNR